MDDAQAYEAIRHSVAVYRRGQKFVEVEGSQRGELLSHVLAKSSEYVQSGSSLETLCLDDDGRPIDLVLAVVDEDKTLLVTDVEDGAVAHLAEAAEELGLDDVTITPLDGWVAVAVEGPKCWRIVENLIEDDLASMALNERRPATSPLGAPGLLVRTGWTAEFCYLWLGQAPAEETLASFVARAEGEGGGACTPDALLRAKLEVNSPVFPQLYEGLTLREAGHEWLDGVGRDDDYRGRNEDTDTPRQRGLIAVRAYGQDIPPAGTPVEAGGTPVGSIFLAAPACGQPDGYALALLDVPFEVPGLELTAGGVAVKTISRPAVDPESWGERIGSEVAGSSLHYEELENMLSAQQDEG
ncbi:MAG: hypothetical protein LBR33_08575 [Propionibacteriaceae bacterium]|jgi:aminomethyltransferase|nr:hypothetical protein [Propionibacteriaceae bacterium]